jgi:hypothetical protein
MSTNLEDLSLNNLFDLLVSKTELLLIAMEKNADGYRLRDLKAEVESIQEMIKTKKAKENMDGRT